MRHLKVCASVLALSIVAFSSAAQAQTYGRLVVFGDSLSDNGNLFRATRGTNPPSPPYFQGRFSNGPVFTELLGFPNLQNFGAVTGNVNNAFGGARTDLQASPPSLQVQLNAYLGGGGRFGAGDLVSVYGGANNIFQSIQAASTSANPLGFLTGVSVTAANDIGALTGRIAAAGAGTVVVYNLPNLGATPQFATGPAAQLVNLGGSAAFNARLATQVAAAAQANTATNFILVDVERANAAVRSSPAVFGFANITTPCLNVATGAVCSNPDSFLYFDGVHPTAAGHRFLAAVAADYLFYGARGAATVAQAEAALGHREQALDAALQQMEGELEEGPQLAVSIEGAEASEDARGDVPDIERSTVSLRAAVNTRLSPTMSAGVMGSVARSDVEAGPLSFEARSLGVDAFVGWRSGPVFVKGVFGGGLDEYDDIARVTGVGPLVQSADRVTGSTVSGTLQAGWVGRYGGLSVSPRAALSAVRVEVDSYEEVGFSARHAVAAREVEAFGAEASVRLEAELGSQLTGHLEGGYGDYLSYDGDAAIALVDNPAKPLTISPEDPGRGFLVDAGVDGRVFGGWQLGVAYRGRFDDGSQSHAALLKLNLRR